MEMRVLTRLPNFVRQDAPAEKMLVARFEEPSPNEIAALDMAGLSPLLTEKSCSTGLSRLPDGKANP